MRVPLPLLRAVVAVGSRPLGPPVPIRLQRGYLEVQAAALGRVPAGTSIEPTSLGGRPAERVTCGPADEARAVLLLHGGAFVVGSPRTHRVLSARLAAASGAAVHVPHYRRAPEHPYPAALDDADAALDELQASARSVAVVGDSAGGALALLLALRRRDDGRRAPAALGLVSPVCDLTLASSLGYDGADPLLRRGWVRQGVDAFVGGSDAASLSPLSRPLHGLPPTYVQLAEHERLRPEGEQLAEALRQAGVDVRCEVLAGLWHDAQLQAQLVPEAADAVDRLGRWLARS